MPRVLILGDAGCKTGFARVTKGVADYLHDTGRWEVCLRGVNFRPNHCIPYRYEVLPASTRGDDPFGFQVIKHHYQTVEPDVVFMVQDLWNLGMYSTGKEPTIPSVGYFPVDCPNVKPTWAIALGAFSEAVAYTKFGAQEAAVAVRRAVDLIGLDAAANNLTPTTNATWISTPMGRGKLACRLDRLSRWQNTANWNVIPHGIDQTMFRRQDRVLARKFFNLPESAFLIGCVNTNQFRKRQDLAIRMLAVLSRSVPEAMLVFHCAGGDSQGWDLVQLADSLGVADKIILVHHKIPALTDEQLNLLYSTFDVHINTSGGEGWGLTTVEAALCGIPQVVPNWSATRELWSGAAILLPIGNWRHEPKGLNTAHCEVDVQRGADLLADLAADHAYRERLGQLAEQRALRQFGWDQVGQAFEQVLFRALRESNPRATSMQDMQRDRMGKAESELAYLATMADYHNKYGEEVAQPVK